MRSKRRQRPIITAHRSVAADDARARVLRMTVGVAWLLGVALSWRLWTSARLYPLAPVSDALPRLDPPFDGVLLALFVGMLLAAIARPRARAAAIAALVLAAMLALLDQTRWQPWFYVYAVMFGACVALPAERALDACRTIVALTYLWSGLQKLNVTFVRQTWPDIAGALYRVLPEVLSRLPAGLALIIPGIEIVTGLGLLTRRFRTPAVAIALLTHAVILAILIQSGENIVVWPWNLAMGALVVLLFWRNHDTGIRDLLLPRPLFQRALVVLFGILPAFSFAGLWDSYLSAALYSGNTYQAVVYMPPPTVSVLPSEIRPAIWQQSPPFFLDINRWAYQEMNVPAYPQPRVYRVVAARVCQSTDNAEGIKLRILALPNLFTGARGSELYDCDHLREIH